MSPFSENSGWEWMTARQSMSSQGPSGGGFATTIDDRDNDFGADNFSDFSGASRPASQRSTTGYPRYHFANEPRPIMQAPMFSYPRTQPQIQNFAPPPMELVHATSGRQHPDGVDWVSKLNLWDQSQRGSTESTYQFRTGGNGNLEHIAEVNVGGRGRIYRSSPYRAKKAAKQEAAMRACKDLKL